MPKTLSLLAVLKKVDAKGIKSLSDPQWNTFLASNTEPNEIEEKIKKLEGFERQGSSYDKTGELIVEDNKTLIFDFKEENVMDQSFEMIASCIDKIYNDEEVWAAADCTKKEISTFLESMNSSQFKEIETFFETMPKLSHTVKIKNPNTQVESTVVLEGLSSFFG